MTRNDGDMIIISKSEYELRKWEVEFSPSDMQEIVEYRDVFIKYIDKRIHKYRANLAMLWYKIEDVWKIYIYIEELLALKKTLEESQQEYKKYIKSVETDH